MTVFLFKEKLFLSWILGANRPVPLSLQIVSLVLPRLEDTIYTFDENILKDPQSLDGKVAGTLETFKSELQPL